MRKLTLVPALVALVSGLAFAQDVRVRSDAKSSTKKVITVTTSVNGKTRTYRKVIKDGKVVEESGDPSLLEDSGLDVPRLLKKVRRDGSKSKRKGRRIIIRDGVEDLLKDLDLHVDVDIERILDHVRRHMPNVDRIMDRVRMRMPEIKRHLKEFRVHIPRLENLLEDFEVHIPNIKEAPRDTEIRTPEIKDVERQIRRLRKRVEKLQRELKELRGEGGERKARRSRRSKI